MGLTVGSLTKDSAGSLRLYTGTITFDSSYPAGGESLVPADLGLHAIRSLDVDPVSGYAFTYNYTTQKVLAYTASGYTPSNANNMVAPLIVEEAVTVASNTGTLSRVPGYIIAVEVTAGSVTGAFRVIPVGKTPTTTMVAVDLTTGVMTFLAADAVTAARVTYIPLGVGPFISSNRVVDESHALASAGRNLANQAALIQYVWNNTASAANRLPAIQPVGEAPGANQIAIDLINTNDTTITCNAAQNTDAGLVTYWKKSAFTAAHGFTDQGDITVTSDAVVIPEALDLSGTFVPCFGNVVVGETGAAANKQAVLLGPSGSVAANVGVYDPAKSTISLANGDGYGTLELAYLVLNPAILPPLNIASAATEVYAGTNLSTVVARFRAWGV